ncbi:MAG: helix-turn-helix domain-containing protein [Chloroflexi bacterium]|nr:helix-turn-helix domain-containing protein [Chloroflexota bacterium]
MTPLGEILRSARQTKGITIEDAERVTRIPKKYLEALEVENYSILPAPVYARGFLRSYAGYLGLDAQELLPFFPVGHVEEPKLEPLPEVRQPRTWNMNSVIAMVVVVSLIAIVVLLYSVGRDDTSPSFQRVGTAANDTTPDVITGNDGIPVGPDLAIPDLVGLSVADATDIIVQSGATFIIVGVQEGDIPAGQVIGHQPPPGTPIGPGDVVTLSVSR